MKTKNKVVRSTTKLIASAKTAANIGSAKLVKVSATDHAGTKDITGQDMIVRPGITAAILKTAGIRLSDHPELGSIEIPYHDLSGKPTGFSRWRLPRERHDGQKYHQKSGTSTSAYIPPQLHTFPQGGDLVIVEGEFKSLSLIDAGIKAVGLPNFNTYTRDLNGELQLLPGIAEVIRYIKSKRILFLGDSDTATNYEFARNAHYLASKLKPIPVLLPRIPVGGLGKGIDDCRQALGSDFTKFWGELVATAEQIDLKAGVGALSAQLLEREAKAIKTSTGADRVKLSRRIVEMVVKCKGEPLPKDQIIGFLESNLGYSRSALKEELEIIQTAQVKESNLRLNAQLPTGKNSDNIGSVDNAEARDAAAAAATQQFVVPPSEPWEQPVDGVLLLDELVALLERYLVLAPHAAEALALFILVTYAPDCFDAAPYVNLTSPEKRCGKTLTLRLLSQFCDRVLSAANCTEASVFRALNSLRPCLMIDEVDTFFADKPQLRGILNAGNVRSEATVLRTVEVRRGGKTEYDLLKFSVFGPKVFSGIGRLADTLADRCIPISMRRKRIDESRPRFRRREINAEPLRQKCRRWANDNAATMAACRPELPPELNDRAADLWEPLLAAAEIAGGNWPQRARASAIALSGDHPELPPASHGERLLSDIYQCFTINEADQLTSASLCEQLTDMEESPWAEACKGRPINANKLARMLKLFGVHSRKIRTSPSATAQGYDRQDFEDAWERYTPSILAGPKRNNGTNPVAIQETRVFKAEQSLTLFQPENSTSTNGVNGCSTVPVATPDLVEEIV